MKRRSMPKQKRRRGSYGRKKKSGNMMYGPTKHAQTHRARNEPRMTFGKDAMPVAPGQMSGGRTA